MPGPETRHLVVRIRYLEKALPTAIGKAPAVLRQICRSCHGKPAFPGKAPKLNPSRYTLEFACDRVTNGFRGMPSSKEQYSEERSAGLSPTS
jgi:hypothetical protein